MDSAYGKTNSTTASGTSSANTVAGNSKVAGNAKMDSGADFSTEKFSVDGVKSAAADFANGAISQAKDIGGRVSGQVIDKLGSIPQMSRQYAGRIDQSARANPWLHIGLIGAGALALGYFLGKRSAVAMPEADADLKEIYNH